MYSMYITIMLKYGKNIIAYNIILPLRVPFKAGSLRQMQWRKTAKVLSNDARLFSGSDLLMHFSYDGSIHSDQTLMLSFSVSNCSSDRVCYTCNINSLQKSGVGVNSLMINQHFIINSQYSELGINRERTWKTQGLSFITAALNRQRRDFNAVISVHSEYTTKAPGFILGLGQVLGQFSNVHTVRECRLLDGLWTVVSALGIV